MIKILVLEDNVERIGEFGKNYGGKDRFIVYVTTVKECIEVLESSEKFDIIFLDHDLGGKHMVESGPDTGYEVAEWLRDHPEKLPQIVVVHSLNPAGRANIYHCLKDLVKTYEYPFAWEKDIIGYK